jgi:hypothetical protein
MKTEVFHILGERTVKFECSEICRKLKGMRQSCGNGTNKSLSYPDTA